MAAISFLIRERSKVNLHIWERNKYVQKSDLSIWWVAEAD